MPQPNSHSSVSYTTREVSQLLSLPPQRIYSYVRRGFVDPMVNSAKRFQFSFQDIVILRTAKGLVDSGIPPRKVQSNLERLKDQLADDQPLTGIQIWADGKDVVAQEGSEIWQPETGQILFNFQVDRLESDVKALRDDRLSSSADTLENLSADDWYTIGCELEPADPEGASDAYRQALALNPGHVEAELNLGRLFHEQGILAEAERCYRGVIAADPCNAAAVYYLGVVLDDMGKWTEAARAYEDALKIDSNLREAHFNLARLYESLGQSMSALRHLSAYRKLGRRT